MNFFHLYLMGYKICLALSLTFFDERGTDFFYELNVQNWSNVAVAIFVVVVIDVVVVIVTVHFTC